MKKMHKMMFAILALALCISSGCSGGTEGTSQSDSSGPVVGEDGALDGGVTNAEGYPIG